MKTTRGVKTAATSMVEINQIYEERNEFINPGSATKERIE